MRKRKADWTIAGLGPLLVLACVVALFNHVPPDVVLGALGLATVVLVVAAEFAT